MIQSLLPIVLSNFSKSSYVLDWSGFVRFFLLYVDTDDKVVAGLTSYATVYYSRAYRVPVCHELGDTLAEHQRDS